MTPAAALTNRIREVVSRKGARLFPMTVGKFWAGIPIGKTPEGHTILKHARIVNVGFTGLSDTLGGSPMTITAEDVGKTVMILTAVEVKAGDDRLRPGQPEFLAAITKMGGRAGVARSPEDAVRICSGEYQNGKSESSIS